MFFDMQGERTVLISQFAEPSQEGGDDTCNMASACMRPPRTASSANARHMLLISSAVMVEGRPCVTSVVPPPACSLFMILELRRYFNQWRRELPPESLCAFTR